MNLGSEVAIFLGLFTVFFIFISMCRVGKLAYKITQNIIQLYETLYEVQVRRNGNEGGVIELSYKASSRELNDLQNTFNKIVKTTNIADATMHDKMTEEKQSQALLSYGDAMHIFKDFNESHSNQGVCLANIGSIMY